MALTKLCRQSKTANPVCVWVGGNSGGSGGCDGEGGGRKSGGVDAIPFYKWV